MSITKEETRPGLISSCGDSQTLISFVPLYWVCVYPSSGNGAAAQRGVGGSERRPIISHRGLRKGPRDTFAHLFVRLNPSALHPSFQGMEKGEEKEESLAFPPPILSTSSKSDDSENTGYVQQQFGLSVKSKGSSRSLETLVELLSWEGAQRGFVNVPVTAFRLIQVQEKSQKNSRDLEGEVGSVIRL